MIMRRLIKLYLFLFLLLVLAGCGGSNATPTITPSPVVTGVAAAGSPLAGMVSMKDSSSPSKELSMPLAADGSFQFDLRGLTAPYILKATGTANGRTFTLYSFAPAAGIANINPLSSLAVTLAYGSDVVPIIYNAPDQAKMRAIADSLASRVVQIQTALRPTLIKFGAESVNFLTAPYVANHRGIDLFLDNADISTSNGIVTLRDLTTNSSVPTTLSGFVAGTFDFILNPVMDAGTVCVFPATASTNTGDFRTFSTRIIGSDNQGVIWSVVEEGGGSITNSGVYTAPATAGTYHVKATSVADQTRSATVPIEVTVANFIKIVPTATPGEYSVMAENFSGIGGVEVTITYDTSLLANPRITQGALLAGAMFISNTKYTASSVRFAAVSINAINGSGNLATVSFDLVGAVPSTPFLTQVKLAKADGTIPRSGGVNSVPNQPQDSSAGGSVPAAGGSGTAPK